MRIMKTIELIVPCYNEEKCVALFYEAIKETFQTIDNYDFIITYIDDGSRDNTLEEIKKVVGKEKKGKIRYISFSRNFGKEGAIYAGLSKSRGDYVAVMDADLQHPPALLRDMIQALDEEGYDCASARRVSRKGEPPIRSSFSRFFYFLIKKITAGQHGLPPDEEKCGRGHCVHAGKRAVYQRIVCMGRL